MKEGSRLYQRFTRRPSEYEKILSSRNFPASRISCQNAFFYSTLLLTITS